MKHGVDLHVHTTASDGSFAPEDVVRMAAEAGLQAIAITDHDNTNALQRCMDAGQLYDIEVIPAIELSADYKGIEVHILGYYSTPMRKVSATCWRLPSITARCATKKFAPDCGRKDLR